MLDRLRVKVRVRGREVQGRAGGEVLGVVDGGAEGRDERTHRQLTPNPSQSERYILSS